MIFRAPGSKNIRSYASHGLDLEKIGRELTFWRRKKLEVHGGTRIWCQDHRSP